MPEPNSTTGEPAGSSSIYPFAYLVQPSNRIEDHLCATARSLVARIVGGFDSILIGLTCKRWACRPCSEAKIRRLAVWTRAAKPNRLLTLTVDPALYATPRIAFDSTSGLVPELIRFLRTRFGELEYLRVTEVCKTGYPHYHLLVRSGFLPHVVVKKEWNRLCGASIVDIRQVSSQFGAYTYLTKYLTKLHHLGWTDRHVSYSRKFFPPEVTAKPSLSELADQQLHDCHPYSWLQEHCMGQTLTQTGPLSWLLGECLLDPAAPRNDGF